MSGGGAVRAVVPALAALLLGYGCGSNINAPVMFTGTPGVPTAFTDIGGLPAIMVSVDGQAGTKAIVDTGAPVVLLDPAAVAGLPSGASVVKRLAVLGVEFESVPVIGAPVFPNSDIPIKGIIGCTLICDHVLAFNYRDAQLTFEPSGGPADLEAVVHKQGFTLAGGGLAVVPGDSGLVELRKSRILAPVKLEGATKTFLYDSGANVTLIRSAAFATLVKDGRTVRVGTALGMRGVSSSSTARLRAMEVAGAEVDKEIGVADASVDLLLDAVSMEVGSTIDGLIGTTFHRHFYVTVDYPGGELRLQRYNSTDFIVDDATRVAIGIDPPTSGRFNVNAVLMGSDAETQGIKVGDQLVAVDGASLATLSLAEASGRLAGKPGASHQLEFGCSGCGGFVGSRTVKVEDILPLN